MQSLHWLYLRSGTLFVRLIPLCLAHSPGIWTPASQFQRQPLVFKTFIKSAMLTLRQVQLEQLLVLESDIRIVVALRAIIVLSSQILDMDLWDAVLLIQLVEELFQVAIIQTLLAQTIWVEGVAYRIIYVLGLAVSLLWV